MRRSRTVGRASAVALLVGLSGCAVLRIDVDVYKGPLANHRDVQTQQLAVMATAAKPLLIELRDIQEWPSRGRPEESADQKNYRAGYMPKEPLKWNNSRARRVNDILSLYEDQAPPGLESYAEAAIRAYDTYYDAQVLLIRKGTGQEKLWDLLAPAMTRGDPARNAFI